MSGINVLSIQLDPSGLGTGKIIPIVSSIISNKSLMAESRESEGCWVSKRISLVSDCNNELREHLFGTKTATYLYPLGVTSVRL